MAEFQTVTARLSAPAHTIVVERARAERRDPADEIGLMVERSLGLASRRLPRDRRVPSFAGQAILRSLHHDRPRSPRDIARRLGKTVNAVQQTLGDLLADGHIERVGYGQYVLAQADQAREE